MTFPLVRLPLLTLREVIKSMNVREIVLFLSLSKKCHQILKASISKKSSLEISFTPVADCINVKILPKIRLDAIWFGEKHGSSLKMGDDLLLPAHFSSCGKWVNFKLTRSGQETQDEELIKTVSKYFTDTIKPLVKFDFGVYINQDLAMELIRYCRLNHIRLSCITFGYGNSASPEYVREILEGGIEEDGKLCIYSSLPRGFEYTPPPGGFKLQHLFVSNAHWVNLNDFLQCEHVHLYRGLHHMTPEYLNNVYKTIVNKECKIKFLKLISNEFSSYSFPELFRGLTDRPIRENGVAQCVEFEGNDGRTTTIIHHSDVIVLRRE